MIIKGSKINLSPIQEEDITELYKWRNSPDLRKNAMIHPYPVSYNSEKNWLENVTKDITNKNIYFGIRENDNKKLIGYCSLRKIDWINSNAVFGIVIGEDMHRGKGYGKEATSLCVEYGFHNLNLQKISLRVLAANERAIHIYESLAFVREGLLFKQFYWNSKFFDVVIMSIFNPKKQ